MTIYYHNRSQLSPEIEKSLNAKYVSFEELLKNADVLSLNCSLRKETVGIIGKKEFALMKKGVVLVNTARGKLVDEQALVDALADGKVFSAGLDVYEEEPKINEGLLNNPNVVLLPHIGTATVETQVCSPLLSPLGVQLAIPCSITNNETEKHGVTGLGEYRECSQEGKAHHAGIGAGEQVEAVRVPYTR